MYICTYVTVASVTCDYSCGQRDSYSISVTIHRDATLGMCGNQGKIYFWLNKTANLFISSAVRYQI